MIKSKYVLIRGGYFEHFSSLLFSKFNAKDKIIENHKEPLFRHVKPHDVLRMTGKVPLLLRLTAGRKKCLKNPTLVFWGRKGAQLVDPQN